MRLLVQNVKEAFVEVEEKVVSKISEGQLVLVAFRCTDTFKIIDKMIEKLLKIRILPDENKMTNKSIKDKNGELLIVSQFTLYADLKAGNRPSFVNSMRYEQAQKMYEYFVRRVKELYPLCEFGIFGADMKIHLINDGPFTVMLDSEELNYE